jgi:hypothetical protein
MKTAFQTGPGMFAADSRKVDRSIPPRVVRVYCARIEAYDITDAPIDLDTEFEILFAKAEKDPRVARALLKLGEAIEANRALLSRSAG